VYLSRSGIADHEYFAEVDAEAEQLAIALRADCRALPEPILDSIFDHVYTEPHPLIDEERAQAAAYHASFASHEDAALPVGGVN
jgi:2-oxoisovalerate dehydrogenase E1 component subunit alpha